MLVVPADIVPNRAAGSPTLNTTADGARPFG
jgi:hypothetical protein